MNKNINNNKSKVNKKAKLKNILCAPKKIICPRLEDEQLEKLKTLLKENISACEEVSWKQSFRLGLESTLRSIKANEVKCVLLSQQLKPRFVLGLIARNVQVVDCNVPVFEHPELEQFCQEVFGIRSLAMTIRKVDLNSDLTNWIRENSNAIKVEPATVVIPAAATKKRKISESENKVEQSTAVKKAKISTLTDMAKKQPELKSKNVLEKSSADFLSFSAQDSDMQRLAQNDAALSKTIKKLSAKAKQSLYQPLVLHKIQPNTNRPKHVEKLQKKKKNKIK